MVDFLELENLEEGKYYSSDYCKIVKDYFLLVKNYMNSIFVFSEDEIIETYYFKYKDCSFQIEKAYAPDLMFFIKKINNNNNDSLIDLEDIKKGVIPDNRKKLITRINSINSWILEMKQDGISSITLKKSIKL